MPDHRKLLLISVLVLTAFLFIDIFIVHTYLPERIPSTTINITGLFLIAGFWVLFYVVFKIILKQDDTISVAYLTVFGCLIILFSEIIFQFYRQFTFTEITNEERIRIFMIGVIGLPVMCSVLAFKVAVELKYKNRLINTLISIGIGLLVYFTSPYVLSFIKGEYNL